MEQPPPRRRPKVTADFVSQLVEKVDACLLKCEPVCSDMRSSSEAAGVFERLSQGRRKTWQQAKRHVHQPQYESMVAHIQNECFSEPGRPLPIVADLGAGKGMVCRMIAEVTGAPTVAIERRQVGTQANYDEPLEELPTSKPTDLEEEEEDQDGADDSHSDEEDFTAAETVGVGSSALTCGSCTPTVRVTADLCDCNLKQILTDAHAFFGHHDVPGSKSVVIAKHLCNNATDLAIQAVQQAVLSSDTSIESMILAPCCHPQIDLKGYTNPAWIREQGFDEDDFELLKQLIYFSKLRAAVLESNAKKWRSLQEPILTLF